MSENISNIIPLAVYDTLYRVPCKKLEHFPNLKEYWEFNKKRIIIKVLLDNKLIFIVHMLCKTKAFLPIVLMYTEKRKDIFEKNNIDVHLLL